MGHYSCTHARTHVKFLDTRSFLFSLTYPPFRNFPSQCRFPLLYCCVAWSWQEPGHRCIGTKLQVMMTSSNGIIFRVTRHLSGNSPVTGEFPAQWPVTRSFDVFFDLLPNKRLSKQWRGYGTHYDVTVIMQGAVVFSPSICIPPSTTTTCINLHKLLQTLITAIPLLYHTIFN